ncbi:MAG: hypothetical protein LBI65_02155 [Candidatus Symbiothrix sp.]|nr:hypothetical protein [Candidatus Symbiothrix sp.]
MKFLAPNWDSIATDSTDGSAGGGERIVGMPDHLPLGVELKIDFSNQYLEKIKR